MRLAIVLSVTKYEKGIPPLPACNTDGTALLNLLLATGEYEDILNLVGSDPSPVLKNRLVEFCGKYRGKDVEEVLFYYSGHGDVHSDGFHFLLSDFAEERRKQTSLTNDELDDHFKSLSPRRLIKVVDACHSGVNYLKGPENFEQYISKAKAEFQVSYFMFSSLVEQRACSNAEFSDFTRAFLSGVLNFRGPQIRYRDIADFISDAFAGRQDQTPVFVTQGGNREVFCKLTQAVIDSVSKYFPEKAESTAGPAAPAVAVPTLVELVKDQSKSYSSKVEAMAFLNGIAKSVEGFKLDNDLAQLFSLSTARNETHQRLRDGAAIGRWLVENSHDLFAHATYTLKEFEIERPKRHRFGGGFMEEPFETEKAIVKRQVVDGFKLTAESPYKEISIELTPLYENLPALSELIIPCFSKRECVLFYLLGKFKETDWGTREFDGDTKWHFQRVRMKDDPAGEKTGYLLTAPLTSFIRTTVRQLLGLKDDDTKPASTPKPVDQPK